MSLPASFTPQNPWIFYIDHLQITFVHPVLMHLWCKFDGNPVTTFHQIVHNIFTTVANYYFLLNYVWIKTYFILCDTVRYKVKLREVWVNLWVHNSVSGIGVIRSDYYITSIFGSIGCGFGAYTLGELTALPRSSSWNVKCGTLGLNFQAHRSYCSTQNDVIRQDNTRGGGEYI